MRSGMTHLGRVALRLQRAEQRLLRSQNLYRARGVLAQVRQAARVRDEARADALAEERGQARRDRVHLLREVRGQRLAVLGQRDDPAREQVDVDHVELGERRGGHDERGELKSVTTC